MNNDDTISRSAAIKALRQWRVAISTERAVAEIEHLPSVQRQVVHGRWERIEATKYGVCYATCSACKRRCARDTVMGKISEQFCKDCGAKMDGGEDDG